MNTDVSRREFLKWSMGGTMSIAGTLPNARGMLISILGPESVVKFEGLSIDGSTLSLESGWKFRSGDDLGWAKPDLDELYERHSGGDAVDQLGRRAKFPIPAVETAGPESLAL